MGARTGGTVQEAAGLSTAGLSPEQLRAAKRQPMKKLGGHEEE
ncbi:MAG: hypothetical protein ACI4L8_10620 [Candidatus Fimadaptatus sp.]